MNYNNGDRYEGNFKNDKPGVKGIYYYNNGHRFEFDFKIDNRDEKGIFYIKEGKQGIIMMMSNRLFENNGGIKIINYQLYKI